MFKCPPCWCDFLHFDKLKLRPCRPFLLSHLLMKTNYLSWTSPCLIKDIMFVFCWKDPTLPVQFSYPPPSPLDNDQMPVDCPGNGGRMLKLWTDQCITEIVVMQINKICWQQFCSYQMIALTVSQWSLSKIEGCSVSPAKSGTNTWPICGDVDVLWCCNVSSRPGKYLEQNRAR